MAFRVKKLCIGCYKIVYKLLDTLPLPNFIQNF